MGRAKIWVFAGLLAYICFTLTFISVKLDEFNVNNLQYAAIGDLDRERPPVGDVAQIAMSHRAQPPVTPLHFGLVLFAMISVFVSWHLSRIYHTHEWTKTVLRKNYAYYTEPYRESETRETLHADQDCVGDPPLPDGRIKDSWLPWHITRLDAGSREPRSAVSA
jgi:hypothetical protein